MILGVVPKCLGLSVHLPLYRKYGKDQWTIGKDCYRRNKEKQAWKMEKFVQITKEEYILLLGSTEERNNSDNNNIHAKLSGTVKFPLRFPSVQL
jgi:hypothetical protein